MSDIKIPTFQAAIMTTLLYAAQKGKIGGESQDLAQELKNLESIKEIKDDVLLIKNSKVPEGYYSEELDSYLSEFYTSGLALYGFPVRLNEDGLKECLYLIDLAKDAYNEKMKLILKKLGI